LCEELDFFLYTCWNWGVVRRRVGITDNVENVQVNDDESEHGKALLFIEVAENTRDGLLAFTV
jgi:hypothetical protein